MRWVFPSPLAMELPGRTVVGREDSCDTVLVGSALQPKLLRVLEDRRVRAIGETHDRPIDVRVISATQEPLGSAVAEARFRPDLHARLDGLTVLLPPLRARREDIAPLFLEFLRAVAGGRVVKVEAKLMEALCLYDWPLNVRELLLLARQMFGVHGHEPSLKKAHLPHRMVPGTASGAPSDGTPSREAKRTWRKADAPSEFEALIEALREHGGSINKAAAAIRVNRSRAYRLIHARPDFSLERVRGK